MATRPLGSLCSGTTQGMWLSEETRCTAEEDAGDPQDFSADAEHQPGLSCYITWWLCLQQTSECDMRWTWWRGEGPAQIPEVHLCCWSVLDTESSLTYRGLWVRRLVNHNNVFYFFVTVLHNEHKSLYTTCIIIQIKSACSCHCMTLSGKMSFFWLRWEKIRGRSDGGIKQTIYTSRLPG